MSESESMEEVPLGFLNEELDGQDDKLIRILEEKKPSMKQRLEQVTAFKSRVLDLLHIAMMKNTNPELLLPFLPDLIHYCTAQPDNSSHVFAKRISGMIMKYFNEKQSLVFSPEVIEANIEDFINMVTQLFNSIMKNKRARNSHSVINPMLKRLLSIKNEAIELRIKECFGKLLAYALAKKDASYIELFVGPIINQKPSYLGVFHTELVELMKLKEDGGPKTDLHRIKALQLITRTVYRLMQSKAEDDIENLVLFLKQGSKEVKKTMASIMTNHEQFKIKKISILKKYIELSVTLLRAYQSQGLAKRFKSLQDILIQEKSNLPEDPVLAKSLKKIEEVKMDVAEEPASD